MIDKHCPYPEFVKDEVSGVSYKNPKWIVYQVGYDWGYREGYQDGIELEQNTAYAAE